MSQSISFRQAAFIVLFLAAVQCLIQMSLLTKGMQYIATSLVIDDTYYYLQTAWNTRMLGFVTFDGLHATNGVQLLWFFVIYGLAFLVKTKAALLFTALAVSFLLNGLCHLIILRIGIVLRQPVLALLMSGLWALQSLPFRIYSMGMENSLHALVFWCAVWQSAVFLIRIQNRERPDFWGLTVVLILNAWTRLDSALLSAVLFMFCVGTLAYTYRRNLGLFLQRHSMSVAGSSGLAVLGLMAQLTAFQLMGDSFLPVSALIKTGGAGQGSQIEPIDKLIEVILLGMPSILQGRFPAPFLMLLGISGILFVTFARAAIRDHSKEIKAFLDLWLCLLIGELIYYAYVALSGVEYRPYFIWYRSPSFIFWIVTGALTALFILSHLRLSSPPFPMMKWASVGLTSLSFVVAVYLFARSIHFTSDLYAARYNAALWIAENSPPDTVFAAWNAGQLGFFSNRTFINLDGLINSLDYYERVLAGSVPLTDYLQENNVGYIVDYSIYHPLPDYPVVQAFPLQDGTGRLIYIWQVSPQLSSAP